MRVLCIVGTTARTGGLLSGHRFVSATCPLLLTVSIWFDTFIFRVAEDESRFEMGYSVINFNLVLLFYH